MVVTTLAVLGETRGNRRRGKEVTQKAWKETREDEEGGQIGRRGREINM